MAKFLTKRHLVLKQMVSKYGLFRGLVEKQIVLEIEFGLRKNDFLDRNTWR